MKKAWKLTIAIFYLLFLVSCQSPQQEAGSGVAVTAVAAAGDEIVTVAQGNDPGEDAQGSGAAMDETDSPANEVPDAITPQPIDECVKCHTDKQALIDTAKPLEVVESENEGEG